MTQFLAFAQNAATATIPLPEAAATEAAPTPSPDAIESGATPTPSPESIPQVTATPQPTAIPEPTTAWVNTESGTLNVRSEPDGEAQVLAAIPRLAQVEVILKGEEWCEVIYLETQGYVLTKYLSFEEQETQAEEAQGVKWVYTQNGNALNLRDAPDGNVLTTIPNLQKVTLIQTGTEWSKVSYNGITGYVVSSYLADTEPTPAQTQAAATATPSLTEAPPQATQTPTPSQEATVTQEPSPEPTPTATPVPDQAQATQTVTE